MVLWDDLSRSSLLVDQRISVGVFYGSFIAVTGYDGMLYKRQSAPEYEDKRRLYELVGFRYILSVAEAKRTLCSALGQTIQILRTSRLKDIMA